MQIEDYKGKKGKKVYESYFFMEQYKAKTVSFFGGGGVVFR